MTSHISSMPSPPPHQRTKGNWIQVRKQSFKNKLRQQHLAAPSKPRLWTSIIQPAAPKSDTQWKQQTLTQFIEREKKKKKIEEDMIINEELKSEDTLEICDNIMKYSFVSSKTPQPTNENLIPTNIDSKELQLQQQQYRDEDRRSVDSNDDILNFPTITLKKDYKKPILSRKRLKLKNDDARKEIEQLLVIESDEEQSLITSMHKTASVGTNSNKDSNSDDNIENHEESQVPNTFADNDLLIIGRGLDIDEIVERGSSCLWTNEQSDENDSSVKSLEREEARIDAYQSSLCNDNNSNEICTEISSLKENEHWARSKGSDTYMSKIRTNSLASLVEGDKVMYLNRVDEICKEKVQTGVIISSSLDDDDEETCAGSLAIEEQLMKTNGAQQVQCEVISLSSSFGDEELLNNIIADSPQYVSTPSHTTKTYISKYASPTQTPSNKIGTYITSSACDASFTPSSFKRSSRKSKIHMSGSSCDSPPWAGFGDTFSSSPNIEENLVSISPPEKPLWKRLGLPENPNQNHQHHSYIDSNVSLTKPQRSNGSSNLRDLGVLSFNSLELPSSSFDWHVDYSPQPIRSSDEPSTKLGKLGVLSFDSAEFPSPPAFE